VGQQDPALVRRVTDDPRHKYELIGGERRWKAAGALGFSHLRAVIKNPANRFEQYKMAVIDNCGKAELPALDTANSMAVLLQDPELKNLPRSKQLEALSLIYTKSTSYIAYHLALVDLDPRVKALMHPSVPQENRLLTGLGAFISTIHNSAEQLHVAEYSISHGLSVKQAREYARRRAEQKGFSVGARALKPSDDFRRFIAFVRRLTIDIDLFRHMATDRVAMMFGTRSSKERAEMLRVLQSDIDRLVEFRQVLRDVDREATKLS